MNQLTPKNLSPQILQQWLHQESVQPLLVDVREQEELSIASFPSHVVHLPLSQSSQWIQKVPELLPSRSIVVICHSGIRSFNFGTWLIEQGWGYEVWNLEGGIDAWSIYIDPSVPRY